MKYKCIKPFQWFDICLAEIGDIITINGGSVINITKSTTYDSKYVPVDHLKECLEVITDEPKIPTRENDLSKFKSITEKMAETFRKKNHDYGNSFEQSLNEEGLAASRIRMGDKWNRFKQLSKGAKAQVNDESLRDTLIDMANYAIMTVMWLDKQK